MRHVVMGFSGRSGNITRPSAKFHSFRKKPIEEFF
jgi:hypothetical protein